MAMTPAFEALVVEATVSSLPALVASKAYIVRSGRAPLAPARR